GGGSWGHAFVFSGRRRHTRFSRDWSSDVCSSDLSATDQAIGTGDGGTTGFQLVKTYGGAFAPWTRDIVKPVAGTVVVAVDGALRSAERRVGRGRGGRGTAAG